MTWFTSKYYAIKGLRISFIVAVINILMAATFPIIFISGQGKVSCGEFLSLSAIPSLMILSERGKIGSASVLMSKLHTRKDFDQMNGVFKLLIREVSFNALIFVPILILINLIIHESTLKILCFSILVCLSGFLNLSSSCLEAYFRGIAQFSQGITLFTIARIFEFLGLIIGIILDLSIIQIVLIGLFGRILGLSFQFYGYTTYAKSNEKSRSVVDSQVDDEYRLAAHANFAIGLGTILQNQIPILFIDKFLGLSLVSDFTILKTFSGFFKTVLSSLLSGANSATTISLESENRKELIELQKFTRKINKVIALLSLPLSVIAFTFWSYYQGKSPDLEEYSLLISYIFGALIDGFFLKDLSFLISTNFHSKLSFIFFLANLFAIVLFIISLNSFGLYSYPLAFLFLDIIMVPFSRIESKKIFT